MYLSVALSLDLEMDIPKVPDKLITIYDPKTTASVLWCMHR